MILTIIMIMIIIFNRFGKAPVAINIHNVLRDYLSLVPRAGNPLNSLSFYNTSREYHQTREGSTLSSTCSRCRQRAYFLLAVTGFLAGAALPLLEAGEVATLLAGTTVLALGLYGFAVVDFFAVGYFLAEAGVLFDA